MKVTYTDNARQHPHELKLLMQATADVEKIPEISASNVVATWTERKMTAAVNMCYDSVIGRVKRPSDSTPMH